VHLLEKKIDGLVTLIEAQSKESQPQGAATNSTPSTSTPRSPWTVPSSQSFQSPRSSDYTGIPTPHKSMTEVNIDGHKIFDVIDRGLVTIATAQTLFDNFRYTGVLHFPFVVIPSHATFDSVRRETPFLFLSIVASMLSSDSSLQRQLGEELRTQIHGRILIGFERNLELLQGLLVHLAWHHYFMLPHKEQVILFSQLSVTLVQQLTIDKNPQNKKRDFELECAYHEQRDVGHTTDPTKMRAMLGTYYLSSS
jgi:hypothetical protein